MEDIKQYGDLTTEELFNFLAEIECDDEDIALDQSEANEKIALEEEQNMLSELPENAEIEAYYGDDAWRELHEGVTCLHGGGIQHKMKAASAASSQKRARNLKEDRIRIQRLAFNQEEIRLSDELGKANIRLLVSLLVKEHTKMIDKYKAFINRRLAALLNPLIPRRLRTCKMLYPDSIRISPGFLYRASQEFGRGLTFWAMPSIPYFFAQNTEQKILMEHKPELLFSVDKAVSAYHEHHEKRTQKELRYASTILQRRVTTYFDLLKLNPFWFETLYNELTKQRDE